MSLEIMLTFVTTSVILGIIPGPSVCFTIAHSLKFGTLRTLPSILGQLAANSLQVFLVFIGLNSLLEQSVGLFVILKMIGAAYLVYLGIKQWRAGEPQFDNNDKLYTKKIVKNFIDGFIVCGTNPKAILYYAAFLPQFIMPQFNKTIQFIVLGVTSIAICGFVLLLYTVLAGKTRYWLVKKGYWRIQNRFTGALMIGAGTALALVHKK